LQTASRKLPWKTNKRDNHTLAVPVSLCARVGTRVKTETFTPAVVRNHGAVVLYAAPPDWKIYFPRRSFRPESVSALSPLLERPLRSRAIFAEAAAPSEGDAAGKEGEEGSEWTDGRTDGRTRGEIEGREAGERKRKDGEKRAERKKTRGEKKGNAEILKANCPPRRSSARRSGGVNSSPDNPIGWPRRQCNRALFVDALAALRHY